MHFGWGCWLGEVRGCELRRDTASKAQGTLSHCAQSETLRQQRRDRRAGERHIQQCSNAASNAQHAQPPLSPLLEQPKPTAKIPTATADCADCCGAWSVVARGGVAWSEGWKGLHAAAHFSPHSHTAQPRPRKAERNCRNAEPERQNLGPGSLELET